DLAAFFRILRLDLDKLSPHVGPAVREPESLPLLLQRGVGCVAVGHHRALVATEHCFGCFGRPARRYPITHSAVRGDRPHVPTFAGGALLLPHHSPMRLVRTDRWLCQDVLAERLVGRLKPEREPIDLVPERLRIDLSPSRAIIFTC